MWQQAERYPDPRVISLDPSFDQYRVAFSAVERLATGYRARNRLFMAASQSVYAVHVNTQGAAGG
jgi:hypothetical protein